MRAIQLALTLFVGAMLVLTLNVQLHITRNLKAIREWQDHQDLMNDGTIHIENRATQAINDNTDSILILTKAVNDIYDRLERLEQQCNPKKMESESRSFGDL